MNLGYYTNKTFEDENNVEPLSTEIMIILITCLTTVIILIICLLSVFCYDCIHSMDEESRENSSPSKVVSDLTDIENSSPEDNWWKRTRSRRRLRKFSVIWF